MSSEVKRAVRVAERVREELSGLLLSMDDPRLAGATVTRVEMTDDLQTARIFVRLSVGGEEPAARRGLLSALAAAAGRLRGDVARAVRLRYAPTLRFHYDEGLDAARRVEELLDEIHREDRERDKP